MTARRRSTSPDSATIAIRVRTGARQQRVGGRYDGPYGPAVTVSVTVPPVAGRATEAALTALAQALRLRRSDLSLRSGTTSRDKLVSVTNPPADLEARVASLRDDA